MLQIKSCCGLFTLTLEIALRSNNAAHSRHVRRIRCSSHRQEARSRFGTHPRQGSNLHFLLVLISSKGNVSRDADGGALSIRPRRLLRNHPRSRNTRPTPCPCGTHLQNELFALLDLCVSSLRRGHANRFCIVPILTDDPRRKNKEKLPTQTASGTDFGTHAVAKEARCKAGFRAKGGQLGRTPCDTYLWRAACQIQT